MFFVILYIFICNQLAISYAYSLKTCRPQNDYKHIILYTLTQIELKNINKLSLKTLLQLSNYSHKNSVHLKFDEQINEQTHTHNNTQTIFTKLYRVAASTQALKKLITSRHQIMV